jgi:outer membrane protein assembly factor BamD (BamD/ComL family)
MTGCASASSWDWLPWKKTDSAADKTAGPKDSLVMRGAGLERDRAADSAMEAELEGARRQFQNKEYRRAESAFHKIANAKKGPLNLIDEALYYEGECQRMEKNFRAAEGTFRKYVKEFRVNGQYVEQANRRLFDIANYWLDDTRQQMAAWEEQREGKRSFVMPASYFHLSKDKPFADMEGHALQILEEVGLADIRGSIRTVDGGPSLGERALFFLATVKFFREDYREADYYYSQLYENHPNSTLAPKAIKQAIICKQVMNGGTAYDTRGVEESRKLIDRFQSAYPEWTKDRDWLTRQLGSIHLQQADRDYQIGEFYRRTGHPGSAYFYFELVRRRYPNTEYAKKAEDHMRALRGLAEREQGSPAANNKSPVTMETPNAFTPVPATTTPSAPREFPATPAGELPEAQPANVPRESPARIALPQPAPSPLPDSLPPQSAPVGPTNSQPPPPLPIGPSSTPAPRLLPPNFGPGGA